MNGLNKQSKDPTMEYWKELRTLMGQLQEQIDTVDAKGSARMYLLENIKQHLDAIQKEIQRLNRLCSDLVQMLQGRS